MNTFKNAYVLKLKHELFENEELYLSHDESDDHLTNDIYKAAIFYDKEKAIEQFKMHDEILTNEFGDNAIRNFGWKNISKNFEFKHIKIMFRGVENG